MFDLQKFLCNNSNALQYLENNLNIKHRRHVKYNNVVLLKYATIDSDFSNILVKQSRGIIFDQKNDWKLLCRTYDKFMNYGDVRADTINWESSKIYSKEDGSLVQLYYYNK